MSWTDWKDGGVNFPGFQMKINADEVGEDHGWVHYLVAPPDEEDPDANHIHLKWRISTDEWVVAAVKVDRIRVINRRELIEAINSQTGLNLQYR